MLDDLLAGLLVGPLVAPVRSNPAANARRLARRCARGRTVECEAYLAPQPGASAVAGVVRLDGPGPGAQWRPWAEGVRQPWRHLTLLEGLGQVVLVRDGRAPKRSAYGWSVRCGDGSEAVLLLDGAYGFRFSGVLPPAPSGPH